MRFAIYCCIESRIVQSRESAMQQSIESDREHTHRAQKTHTTQAPHRSLTSHARPHDSPTHQAIQARSHTRASRAHRQCDGIHTRHTDTTHTRPTSLHPLTATVRPMSASRLNQANINARSFTSHLRSTAGPGATAQMHAPAPPALPPPRPSPRPRPPSQAGMRPQHSTAVVSLILHCDWQWPGPLRYKRRRMVCSVRRGRVAACTPLRLQVMPAP